MKPNDYIKKYKLKETENFNHNAFANDLAIDFVSSVEAQQGSNWNIHKFEHCVKEIRDKYDSISNKSIGTGLPNKLWNFFYASVVCEIRNDMFSEEMERRRKKWEEELERKEEEKRRKEKEREEWEEHRNNFYEDQFSKNFLGFLKWMSGMGTPVSSFQILGCSEDSTEDQVKAAYRSLAMKHHPDKGGNADMFRKIVEAKNKCIAYVNRNK